jgi:hypothetical protein
VCDNPQRRDDARDVTPTLVSENFFQEFHIEAWGAGALVSLQSLDVVLIKTDLRISASHFTISLFNLILTPITHRVVEKVSPETSTTGPHMAAATFMRQMIPDYPKPARFSSRSSCVMSVEGIERCRPDAPTWKT